MDNTQRRTWLSPTEKTLKTLKEFLLWVGQQSIPWPMTLVRVKLQSCVPYRPNPR